MIGTALRTIAELPFTAATAYGDQPAHRARRGGEWVDTSFRELAGTVRALARGLVRAGIAPGDRVAVLAENRPEWSHAGLAVLAAGAVLVPIYPSSSAEECRWILSNSGARLVVCANAAQRDKVAPTATVVIDDGGLAALASDASAADTEIERRLAGIDPDDPSIIIYTSGTTGPPKGCVLTHRNWLTLCAINEQLGNVVAGDVVYLFLPQAHVFAQITQYASLDAGATLVYFGGDVRAIVPELAQVRPTFLPSGRGSSRSCTPRCRAPRRPRYAASSAAGCGWPCPARRRSRRPCWSSSTPPGYRSWRGTR